jgi:hypothetical protein
MAAGGDHHYLFFFDDDFAPSRFWIEQALVLFESSPDIVGISGRVISAEPSPPEACAVEAPTWYYARDFPGATWRSDAPPLEPSGMTKPFRPATAWPTTIFAPESRGADASDVRRRWLASNWTARMSAKAAARSVGPKSSTPPISRARGAYPFNFR